MGRISPIRFRVAAALIIGLLVLVLVPGILNTWISVSAWVRLSTWQVLMTTWALLPSFFWLRGVWRDATSDRWAAAGIFFVFALLATAVDGTTYPLNIAGYFVIAWGFLTMMIGPLRKTMPFRRALHYGLGCILCGILLGMLI